jgi:hypothetical protein
MQFLARYLQKLPGQPRAEWETCLYGLAAGAATVAFQVGINMLYRVGLLQLSHQSLTTFLIGSFAVIVSTSLLVGWLLSSFCPEAAGSGIPQLKLVFWKEFGTLPWRASSASVAAQAWAAKGPACNWPGRSRRISPVWRERPSRSGVLPLPRAPPPAWRPPSIRPWPPPPLCSRRSSAT